MSDSIYRPPYRRPPTLRLSLPAIPSGPVLLEDDFNDNSRDIAKWTLGSIAFENTGVGVDEANQQIEITPLANEASPAIYGYKSVGGYDFTAREVSVRIAADIGAGTEAWLVVALDADNYFRTWVAGGTLQTRSRVAASNSNQSHGAFDFSTHTYWRIRHDNDTDEIVWEYSSSGSSWNELRRLARPFSITFMRVYLSGGTGSSVASPALVKFDDFSLRTPEAFATHERSAVINATASIESAGQFFSVFAATVAVDASMSVAVSGQRDLLRSTSASAIATIEASGARVAERSAAISATGAVESSGITFSVFEAAASVDVNASVESSGIGFSIVEAATDFSVTSTITVAGVREVERLASYVVTGAIESSGESFTLFEAAVAVDATTSIESAAIFFSVFERQSSLDCTTTITTTGQSELLRQAALSATGTITVAGQVGNEPVVHERSAAFAASGEVGSAGEFFSILTASVAVAAIASITINPQRELQRSVEVVSVGAVASSGEVIGAVSQRSVSFTAIATITASATVQHPAPPKRTFMVSSAQRTTVVPPEIRVFKPSSDNRSQSA